MRRWESLRRGVEGVGVGLSSLVLGGWREQRVGEQLTEAWRWSGVARVSSHDEVPNKVSPALLMMEPILTVRYDARSPKARFPIGIAPTPAVSIRQQPPCPSRVRSCKERVSAMIRRRPPTSSAKVE